jgi:hypothetical protein
MDVPPWFRLGLVCSHALRLLLLPSPCRLLAQTRNGAAVVVGVAAVAGGAAGVVVVGAGAAGVGGAAAWASGLLFRPIIMGRRLITTRRRLYIIHRRRITLIRRGIHTPLPLATLPLAIGRAE